MAVVEDKNFVGMDGLKFAEDLFEVGAADFVELALVQGGEADGGIEFALWVGHDAVLEEGREKLGGVDGGGGAFFMNPLHEGGPIGIGRDLGWVHGDGGYLPFAGEGGNRKGWWEGLWHGQ